MIYLLTQSVIWPSLVTNNTMVLKITCRNQFKIKISIFSNINLPLTLTNTLGPSWSWSYGSWIYNYLFAISAYHHYHCEFESHSWQGVLATTLCDKVCQWIAAGQWFSLGTLVSSTNKIDSHDISEILLKVALNTITITNITILYSIFIIWFQQIDDLFILVYH